MNQQLVHSLDDPAAADPGVAGNKAATLATLRSAGLRIPDGFVITMAAFDRAAGNGTGRARFSRQQLPAEVRDAIIWVAGQLGDWRYAVRSSATAEDLPGRSSAGQFESVLDVHGAGELFAAVETCWASALNHAVSDYQDAEAAPPRMALLIQRMVPAVAAGVAFSVDPVTRDSAAARVSAVGGLGDRLAGGSATPEEWTVDANGASCIAGRQGAVDADTVSWTARLAANVAELRGGPQDIEWVLAEDGIWLVQARPVTGVSAPREPVDVPPGHWRRANNAQRPLSPMQRSLVLPAMNNTVGGMFDFSMTGGVEFAVIGGWLYSRHRPLDGRAAMEKRVNELIEALERERAAEVIDKCYTQWLPDLKARLTDLGTTDLARMSDAELVDRLDAVVRLTERALDVHFAATGAQMFVLGRLGTLCDELLGWAVPDVLALLDGLAGKMVEATARLAELSNRAAERPVLRQLMNSAQTPSLDDIEQQDADFAAELGTYLRRYGRRTMSFDIDEPTMAERPKLVLATIAEQVRGAFDPVKRQRAAANERRAARQRVRTELAGREVNASDRNALEHAIDQAQWAYPVRDDTDFYRYSTQALVREAVLEIGRRLAGRSLIEHQDSVFLLARDEATAALGGDQQSGRVAERAAELAREGAGLPPMQYGEPPESQGGGSPMESLPPKVRHAIGAAMWTWQAFGSGRPPISSDDAALAGQPASTGRCTGPARIIAGEKDFDNLCPGDVLVCREISAQWSVLFAKIGGLVTDSGGLLSHPAILAREYRIPAVVATGSATDTLHDGQMVTVDGDTGRVELATGAWR